MSRLYKIQIELLFQVLAYWEKLIIRHILILIQIVKIFLPLLKKHTVVINPFNSTSELISSSEKSSNEFMSRETLVDKLEQPSNVFCTGKYCKYNINTFQQSTDTLQNFNSDLSKISDLPLSALEKSSDCYSSLL